MSNTKDTIAAGCIMIVILAVVAYVGLRFYDQLHDNPKSLDTVIVVAAVGAAIGFIIGVLNGNGPGERFDNGCSGALVGVVVGAVAGILFVTLIGGGTAFPSGPTVPPPLDVPPAPGE